MRLSRAPRLPDPVRPEMELLVCCAMAEAAASAPRIEALLEQEIDWTSLVRLALAHGMTPLLARSLERVSAGVPEEIADALRSHLEDNRARNRVLATLLVDLLDALRE